MQTYDPVIVWLIFEDSDDRTECEEQSEMSKTREERNEFKETPYLHKGGLRHGMTDPSTHRVLELPSIHAA